MSAREEAIDGICGRTGKTRDCQHHPCTTCPIVSDQEFEATVFGTAVHGGAVTSAEGQIDAIADALLPVVRAYAAEQLRDAAEQLLWVTAATETEVVSVRDLYAVADQLDGGRG